jgi:hypothetical protein
MVGTVTLERSSQEEIQKSHLSKKESNMFSGSGSVSLLDFRGCYIINWGGSLINHGGGL